MDGITSLPLDFQTIESILKRDKEEKYHEFIDVFPDYWVYFKAE